MRPEPTNAPAALSRRFSVAPMMDWTDRHCRFFLRQLSRHTLLYTEMVTTGALLHGDRQRFLRYDECEHPLALQLGGSVPAELAACARLAEEAGYDEVNLNVGCPSDRVQHNMIGACLMGHPALVADCVKAMLDAVEIAVTVKHRIGINGATAMPNSAISSARYARPAAGASPCMRGSPSSKGSRPRRTARCHRCATRSRRN